MTGRYPSVTNRRLVSAPMTPMPPVIKTFMRFPLDLGLSHLTCRKLHLPLKRGGRRARLEPGEAAATEPLVAMPGVDDGTISFRHEPPARLRAHDAHAAGDQDLHAFPLGLRVIAFDVPQTPPPLEKGRSPSSA